MSDIFDDDDDDDRFETGQSKPSRRERIVAMQESTRAVEAATLAAQKTSRYLPWLVAIAAICAVISAAAIALYFAASLIRAPQSLP